MEFKHISVLLNESVEGLNIKPDGIYVDATLGGGGHSLEILKKLSDGGRLIGIDQDKDAINAASKRLKDFSNVTYINDNFKNIKSILDSINVDAISGAVLDLGVSSYQLDERERGFSYMGDAKLDMRMNRDNSFSAYNVVNEYTEEKLADIFFKYGEEKFSRKIAKIICEKRLEKPVETTAELVDIIKRAIPERLRVKGSHPAKRVFQAIRIEVNGELDMLEGALRDFFEKLESGGRLCVITFHSLEDRIVKNTFASFTKGCTCPKEFPICVCGNKPKGKLVSKKPVIPSDAEMELNARSKSSKLRIIEKL